MDCFLMKRVRRRGQKRGEREKIEKEVSIVDLEASDEVTMAEKGR